MRPGYRFDDRFRMVEDEFDATARLFTAHLHRAEYKRLQRLASARSPNAATKISRAVDPNAKISTSHSSIKKAEERKKGIDEALEKSGLVRQKDTKGREDESAESDNDENLDEEGKKAMIKARDRPTDQWRGTHLASLMSGANSAEKSGVSLIGLQGIPSSTRAAAGYKRLERKEEEEGKIARRSWGYRAPIRMEPRTRVGGPAGNRDKRKPDQTLSSDEDDLRSMRHPKKDSRSSEARSGKKPRSTVSVSFADTEGQDVDPRRPANNSTAGRSVYNRYKTTSFFNELDRPLPSPSLGGDLNSNAGARGQDKKVELTQARSIQSSRDKLQEVERRRAARLKRAELKVEEVDKGTGRRLADEIPLFMVA